MRIFCLGLLIIFNYVLQSTLLMRIAILDVFPDTALIFIVSYAILRGDVEGAVFGFFAGLIQDIFGASFIGLYAMLGMLAGYIAGKPFKDYFKENYSLPFMVVIIIAFSYQIILFFVNFLIWGRFNFLFYFGAIILPKTIYTAMLAIPLYGLMFLINSRITRYENK